MRKYLVTLIVLLTISLYACDNLNLTGPSPGIQGVDDITLNVGDVFYPLEDVYVRGEDESTLRIEIEVSGLEQLGIVNDRVYEVGEFTLHYEAGEYTQSRTITVVIGDTIDADLFNTCGNPVIEDYVIAWCDEFTGVGESVNDFGVDLNKWGFQLGTGTQYGLTGWGNNEAQYYREENARVEDGRLIIEARRESYGGMNYTSARLYTKPTFHQTYGRFEAKIRLPVGDGLWPAYWMMPQDDVYGGWAASGEIDIMEAKGRYPNQSVAALHFGGAWPDNTHSHRVYNFPSGSSIADYNVYAIEWEEGVIRWYVNDVLVKAHATWYTEGHAFPAPFDQDFYMLLNLAIGGSFDGGILPPDSLFDEPVLMEVDYVRVYQKLNEEE